MEKGKRGRRPKVPQIVNKVENVNIDTPIIAHLPIDLSEVIDEEVAEIFIKPEHNDGEIKILKKRVEELTLKLSKYEKIEYACFKQ